MNSMPVVIGALALASCASFPKPYFTANFRFSMLRSRFFIRAHAQAML